MFVLEKHVGNHECRQSPPTVDEDVGLIFPPCIGRRCMGWRWRPIMATRAFVNALEAAAKDLGISPESLNGPNSSKAHRHLKENPERFGFSFDLTEGYCGFAGEPKANHTERK